MCVCFKQKHLFQVPQQIPDRQWQRLGVLSHLEFALFGLDQRQKKIIHWCIFQLLQFLCKPHCLLCSADESVQWTKMQQHESTFTSLIGQRCLGMHFLDCSSELTCRKIPTKLLEVTTERRKSQQTMCHFCVDSRWFSPKCCPVKSPPIGL